MRNARVAMSPDIPNSLVHGGILVSFTAHPQQTLSTCLHTPHVSHLVTY